MELGIGYIALVLVVVLFSMTLHEAMHAFTSNWLGDDTAKAEGRLTLNPIAHIDPFLTIGLPLFLAITAVVTQTPLPIFGGAKPVPFNPMRVRWGDFGAALVGVAGPLTNFVLAFLLFAIFVIAGTPGGLAGIIFQTAIIVNLGFFIFNMLPIPPLDGSRVLYAIAPDGARRVMEAIEQFGIFFIFAVVILFSNQLGQFIYGAINFFIGLFSGLFGI